MKHEFSDTYGNKSKSYLAAAKRIDSWCREFSCLELDEELVTNYDAIFKPDENKHTWIFNDINETAGVPEDVYIADQEISKEYRVIALLFAHEMQRTGDFHL